MSTRLASKDRKKELTLYNKLAIRARALQEVKEAKRPAVSVQQTSPGKEHVINKATEESEYRNYNMSVEVRVEPTPTPQTFHWVNVFVGILDSTFHLLEEEQFFTAAIIQELLESLHVDDRPAPEKLPSPLALELASEFYSLGLVKTRDVSVGRSVREAHPATPAPSVTAWAQAFVSMLHVAYPDLDPLELFQADKVFTDILVSLGVPRRAALHTPDDVLRSYQATDVEP